MPKCSRHLKSTDIFSKSGVIKKVCENIYAIHPSWETQGNSITGKSLSQCLFLPGSLFVPRDWFKDSARTRDRLETLNGPGTGQAKQRLSCHEPALQEQLSPDLVSSAGDGLLANLVPLALVNDQATLVMKAWAEKLLPCWWSCQAWLNSFLVPQLTLKGSGPQEPFPTSQMANPPSSFPYWSTRWSQETYKQGMKARVLPILIFQANVLS